MLKIGLTGGIGSGKSTAAKIFRLLGVPVYDSDSQAKELMHTTALRDKITAMLGVGAYRDGTLDRSYIAGLVFKDRALLGKLNAIVHPAVMEDFDIWADGKFREGYGYVIQENAILFDHGFNTGMDYTVTISAPAEERVSRSAIRDGHAPQDIRNRMANQISDGQREALAEFTVRNGERDLIVPQIEKLHLFFNSQVEHR